MNDDEEMYDGYDLGEQIIAWKPWKKKFAILPKKTPAGRVWFKYYYERIGHTLFFSYRERGTLLDVIRGKNDELV